MLECSRLNNNTSNRRSKCIRGIRSRCSRDSRPAAGAHELEEAYTKLTLDHAHGNRKLAAEMLGISLRTVRKWIAILREEATEAAACDGAHNFKSIWRNRGTTLNRHRASPQRAPSVMSTGWSIRSSAVSNN